VSIESIGPENMDLDPKITFLPFFSQELQPRHISHFGSHVVLLQFESLNVKTQLCKQNFAFSTQNPLENCVYQLFLKNNYHFMAIRLEYENYMKI